MARKLITAYNRFGFNLFTELVKNQSHKNILVSPISVAFSLAMLYHGAGGETRQAISKVLGLEGIKGEGVYRHNAVLRTTLDEVDSQVEIMLVTALWIDEGLSFDPDFLQLSRQFYMAEATRLDFNDPATANIINQWLQEKTNGKLDHIINEDELKALEDCILTNAVYFKGLWATPFQKKATRKCVFHRADGNQKRVPFMSQTIQCPYLREDAFQAISLPYGNGRISMCIFLPNEDSSLKDFLGKLNAGNWNQWMSALRKIQVELMLPRFRLTYEANLEEHLSNLGMGIVFDNRADFSPMGLGHHFVSKIKHQAMVDVNEEGTEAAATTAVFMGRSLFTPPRVIMNRPFFWALRDNTNETLLFIGVVVEPD